MRLDFAQMDISPITSDKELEELVEAYVEEPCNTTLAEHDREAVVNMLQEIRIERVMDEENQE